MSNILQINSQDYDDDDIIAGNVIVNNEGKTQEIIVNVQESERGPRGVGIPEGGTPGQVMVKQSLEDFNVAWTNLDIPTKTSDLINDTDFVSDDHYVHTDNNFTTPEKEKLDDLANITIIGDNLTLANGRLDAIVPPIPVVSVNGKTGAVVLKTSDITNDSNYVSDANYVHTDNNFATSEKNKLDSLANITTIGDNLTLTNGRLDAVGGDEAQVYRGDVEPTDENILIWIDTYQSPLVGVQFITQDDKDFITSDDNIFTTS